MLQNIQTTYPDDDFFNKLIVIVAAAESFSFGLI